MFGSGWGGRCWAEWVTGLGLGFSLLLKVMELLCVGGGALLDSPCMVF